VLCRGGKIKKAILFPDGGAISTVLHPLVGEKSNLVVRARGGVGWHENIKATLRWSNKSWSLGRGKKSEKRALLT